MFEREFELTPAKKNECEKLLQNDKKAQSVAPAKTSSRRWSKYLWTLLIGLMLTGVLVYVGNRGEKGLAPTSLANTIPMYYGPAGSVDQLVFYSHYLSRMSRSSSKSEIAVFSTALANFVKESSKTLSNSDMSTAQSILKFLEAYLEVKASESLPNFLNSIFGLVQMEQEDIADEVPLRLAEKPYNTQESIEQWRSIQDSLATSGPSKVEHTEIEYEFMAWIDGVRQGKKLGYPKLTKCLRNIVAAAQTSNVLKYSTDSKFKAVGMLFREFERDNSEHSTATVPLKFAAVFETLKLALNLDATDLIFTRFLESLVLGWQQYKYLDQHQIQKVITAINSPEKDPSLATSVMEIKKLQLSMEDWVSLSKRLW
jgi:hypothetical protein